MIDSFQKRKMGIKQVIHGFILQRAQSKLEKMDTEDPKYLAEKQKYQPEVWLENAVTRVGQIQVVTHPLKSTYPNAQIRESSSLYCRPKDLPQHDLIASHVLGESFEDDVTGNAAALDIFALLQQEYENKTLLQLCLDEDKAFIAALHDDLDVAEQWAQAFASVIEPKTSGVASHTAAKQLYWLEGNDPYEDDHYLLLSPLHSSSLAQAIFQHIDASRFSEQAKEIREAIKNNKKHEGVAHYYPNLAVQMIGGSKPQNISALTNKRKGVNYLLASLPPQWKTKKLLPPFYIDSIFKLFVRQRNEVCNPNYWLRELKQLFALNPPANRKTRQKVERLVQGLLDELYMFGLMYQQQLEPGWSADVRCQLPSSQQFWLDENRALQDEDFAQRWLSLDWERQLENDFARWLNLELGQSVSYLGDVEFHRWARAMRNQQTWQQVIRQSRKQLEQRFKDKSEYGVNT